MLTDKARKMEMVKEDDFSDRQRELYQLMSDISEECYCAGWMVDNEHTIWSAMQGGSRSYGMSEIKETQLEQCQALSKELDGWIVWADDETEKGLPIAEWGPRFAPMAKWLEAHSKYSDLMQEI